jgi:hypothetical protein
MADDELDEALAELEETRMTAEEELATIRGRKEILEELERDRDALLESYAEMTPEALDALTPEEQRQVYGMLRLRVEVFADGRMEARGILSENLRVLYENGRQVDEEGFVTTVLHVRTRLAWVARNRGGQGVHNTRRCGDRVLRPPRGGRR